MTVGDRTARKGTFSATNCTGRKLFPERVLRDCVIYVTGHFRPKLVNGVCSHVDTVRRLQKPFTARGLLGRVREVLE